VDSTNFAKLSISLPITVCQGYTSYWSSGNFRHICFFTASSDSRFVCFITLSTSLSHFISGLPILFLPSADQVNIRIGRLLSPTRNIYPYHFKRLFVILSRIVRVILIVFLNCVIPCLKYLDVFAALLKQPISLLNSILFIYLFILQSAVQISQPWLKMLSTTG
jgi:hypothetical protein